jgi:ankyrin repeat protein
MVRILDEGLPFASDDIDVRGEGEYDTALSCVLMLNKLYAPRENFRDDWKLAVPPLNWPEGRQGNAAIARLLFTSGAITTKDAPPLAMMTVSHGDTDGLAVLMEAGVDPDSSTALVNTTSDRPYFVGTALHLGAGRLFAASKHKMVVDEQLAVIEVLLQYGADVDNVAGHPDFTAEEVVAQQSHIQHTALEAAVLENGPSSLRLLKLLLRHNATVDTRSMDLVAGSFENATPLMLAAGRGNVKAVSALLKADASAELTDARGRTPLILAVSLVYLRAPDLEHAGHGTDLEIATRVIEYKLAIVDGLRAATLIAKTATGQASFSHRDDDRGWTALTHTMAPMRAQRGMTKLDDGVDDISHRALKMLLRHGANPNDWHLIGPNDIGKDPDEAVTPLMMAALWCGLRVPSAQEMRDELPDGSIAESAIEEDVAEWFEQMHQNTLLGQHDRHKTMVQILLEAGADAMMQNHENKTAIDLAEEHDHRELAQLMRASLSGLDGSTGSGSGRYKSDDDLSAAVSQGVSQDAIRSLLYNGARADAFNSGGTTALMVAVSIGRTDAARVLLDTGRADPDVLSRMSFTSKQHIKSDITALIMAASQGDAEMTKALLAQGQQ